MNLTEKKHNLFKLWFHCFTVVNRSVGKLTVVILMSLLLAALVMGVLMLLMKTSGLLANMHMLFMSKTLGVGAVLLYFLVMFISNIYGSFFLTVCWRILGAHAEESPLPLVEAFSSSVFPTIYQVICAFIITLPTMFVLGLVGLLHSSVLNLLIMIALALTLGVRLCYSFLSIALAGKGPIEALACSWNLTKGKNYMDALCMCLITVGTVLLWELLYAAIAYGAFVMIPLHFADSFNLAHLSAGWWLAALMFAILAIFLGFIVITFPALVFLNRYGAAFSPTLENHTTDIPLPDLDLTEVPTTSPKHAQMAQSTGETSAQKLEEWQVSQSSVNASDTEVSSLSEHLDKVYKPQQEDVVQYADEDRMPTILFDDEMAKQLEENQAKFAPRQKTEDKPEDKDEGPQSIKMSKF